MSKKQSLLALAGFVAMAGLACIAIFVSEWTVDSPSGPSSQPSDQATYLTFESETRVNTFTSSTQANSDLAVTNDGHSFVVWDSRRQQAGTYGVYLQKFDASGQRIGSETRVNLYQQSMQVNPCIACDGNGGYWIAWESFGQDGSMNAIIARRFDAAGIGGDEILVNQHTQGQQANVVVAVDGDGNATFAWTTPIADQHSRRIVARTFDSSGKPLTDELPIHESLGSQQLPSLAIRANDDRQQLILVWSETDDDNHPAGVFAKQADSIASLHDRPAVQVSPMDNQAHIEAVVTATDHGFVVGWLRSTANDYQAVLQRFDEDANRVGRLTSASPIDGRRINGLALALHLNNDVIAAWNRSTDGAIGRQSIVEARQFTLPESADRPLQPVGEFFQVNRNNEATHQLTPATGTSRLAIDDQARLFAVWNGHVDDDKSAVGITVRSSSDMSHSFALASAPSQPSEQAVTESEAIARPHDPPIFNAKTVPRDRFGGDRSPWSRSSAFGFVGITNTGWRPPDPTIAVGPSHIVATTNGEIAFFDKQGTLTFQDEIEGANGFWGAQGSDGFVFDPEVLFDPHSNRFFAMANERDNGGFFLLAVSDDDDPNGNWNRYRFDVTNLINDDDIDSPNMAIDVDTVYLTADFFGPDKYLIFMLDKQELINGAVDPPSTFLQINNEQSHGIAMNYDADSPATYMIRGDEFVTSSTLHLSAIVDSLGTPSIVETDITVPTYGHPVDPVSMGTSIRPELFESRFWSCVYRNGSLWAVHHQSPDSSTDVARVTWYEFDMQDWPVSGNSPILVQSGEIHPDPDTYTFFPSIWVDDGGNAAITFARSSSNEFISMCRSLRFAGDPLGEFQPLEFVRLSDAAYTLTRWGDYSGTMCDPVEPGTFWGIHQYAPTATSWNTWVGKYELPYIEIQAEGSKFLDGVVTAGQLSDVQGSDGLYLEIDPSPTRNLTKQNVDLILQTTSPTPTPASLEFRIESKMLGGPEGDVIQLIRLQNYQTGDWESVDVRPVSVTDNRILISPTGDLTRFVNPANNEMTARLTWNSEQFAGAGFIWSIDLDQAMWQIVQ